VTGGQPAFIARRRCASSLSLSGILRRSRLFGHSQPSGCLAPVARNGPHLSPIRCLAQARVKV
jgi:hypothetical protein